MKVMDETKNVEIAGEEYYPLPDAAKMTKMTGWGLKQRLIRMGKDIKTRPGSNRIYVRKKDIDLILGKEPE